MSLPKHDGIHVKTDLACICLAGVRSRSCPAHVGLSFEPKVAVPYFRQGELLTHGRDSKSLEELQDGGPVLKATRRKTVVEVIEQQRERASARKIDLQIDDEPIMLGPPDPPQPSQYTFRRRHPESDLHEGLVFSESGGVARSCVLEITAGGEVVSVAVCSGETDLQVREKIDAAIRAKWPNEPNFFAAKPVPIPVCLCRGAPGVGPDNCSIHTKPLVAGVGKNWCDSVRADKATGRDLRRLAESVGISPEFAFAVGGQRITVTFDDSATHAEIKQIVMTLRGRAGDHRRIEALQEDLDRKDHRLAALAKLDVALPKLQIDLMAFARRFDRGEVVSECITCGVCQTNYIDGDGHFGACPECQPGVVTYTQMLTNPSFWPGHRFIWSEGRGPRGRWVLLEDNLTVKRADLDMLNSLLPPEGDPGQCIFQAFAEEMKRLQGIAREVAAPLAARAESESKRAIELGDKCGALAKRLDLKRIECDKLRDELEAMRERALRRKS